MNVFFDVDFTILGADGHSLRPLTREVFARLRNDGHAVYVWSGEGERWAVVRRHELGDLVDGVYGKPLHHYRARLAEFNVPVVPDFVVDDYLDIVRCFGGICIPEYQGVHYLGTPGGGGDTALEEVYQAIRVVAAGGTPDHPRYHPPSFAERPGGGGIKPARGCLT